MAEASKPWARPREGEAADAAWRLTGVGLLKSAASSEPEDRLCIPTTIDDGSAVSDRVACVNRGRRRGGGSGSL